MTKTRQKDGPLLRAVLSTIREHRLFNPHDRVLVCVSGGADSIALLVILHRLRRRLRIQLAVAHLNHRLRGEQSAVDEEFVRTTCRRLRVPFHSRRSDVARSARRRRVSIEMAGRAARYRYFRALAREHDYTLAATGHTADDQAETILMRLARGSGVTGLGGIRYAAQVDRLRVVRPLRDVRHTDLAAFLRREGVDWREDAGNADPAFLRNRVRHHLIPWLETELNPRGVDAICRAGELAAADDDWLNQLSLEILRSCAIAPDRAGQCGGLPDLCLKTLCLQPLAARRRVVLHWLVSAGVVPERIGCSAIEAIDRLIRSSHGSSSLQVAGDWRVRRSYGRLSLMRNPARTATQPRPFRAALSVPGETMLPGPGLRVVTWSESRLHKDAASRAGTLPAQASIEASAIGRRRIYVRSWRPGDRMRPLGGGGSRKLQDIFVDQKVERERRADLPIIECGGDVIWIPGYRVAEGWQVQSLDRAPLQIMVEPV